LILLNPVIDTSKKGYGNGRIGPDWEKISPVHQVRRGAPPTIVFHGTADRTTPYRGAKLFDEAMRAAGNICELYSHEGGDHGYYREDVIFDATMELIRDFSNRHNLL
jgi:acetyl esterase